ncbi:MAG TPA: MFS transporter [Rhizomicrobium sp.]|nr:MFS transporter [Rhizomicrobium sp.]
MNAPDKSAQLGSFRTKLFYGFGSVAYGVKDGGFGTLLLLYYNQVIGLPAQLVGTAILVALLFDAFADPIVGQISDNLRTRWGRRHPFMYASAIPVAVSFYFLWSPPHLSQDGMFFYLIAMAIVVRTFITMFEIPNSAMIAEVTSDYDQRTSFLSYRYFFGVMGGVVMGFVTFKYILVPSAGFPNGQLNPAGYVRYGLIAAIVMASSILISSLGTHRNIKYFRIPPVRRLTLAQTLSEMWSSLSNPSFVVLMGAALCGTVAIGVSGALLLYFATYFWGLSAAQIAIFTAAQAVSAIIGVIIATPLSKRFGKRALAIGLFITFIVVSSAPIALRLIGFFPPNGSPFLVPLLFTERLISGTLGIVVLIMFSSMLTDVVEDNELRTKRRSEGLYFAASSFVAKAISGAGAFIAGQMLGFVHFPQKANPATLDPTIIDHLAYIYLPFIAGMFTLGMILMSRYRITRESHLENLKKLEESAELAHAPVTVERDLTDGLPAPSVAGE